MLQALAPEDTSPPLILLTVCHSERHCREESAGERPVCPTTRPKFHFCSSIGGRTIHRMSTRREQLKPKVRQVKRVLNKIIRYLDQQWICPRAGVCLDTTVLTLLSKSLALARSTVCLVQNGFHEEAFASSRILLELALTLRYITNGATPELRAKRYIHHVAKIKMEHGARAVEQLFWTQKTLRETAASYKEFQVLKRKYPKQGWLQASRKHSKGIWTMAMEPDRFEKIAVVDNKGKPVLNKRGKPKMKPFTWEFDYRIIYFWTSQFVHVTVDSLDNHAATPDKTFKIYNPQTGTPVRNADIGTTALFNTVVTMHKILIAAFRSVGHEFPERLSEPLETCVRSLMA